MYSCLTPKDPSNPSVVTSDLYPQLRGHPCSRSSPALGLFLSLKWSWRTAFLTQPVCVWEFSSLSSVFCTRLENCQQWQSCPVVPPLLSLCTLVLCFQLHHHHKSSQFKLPPRSVALRGCLWSGAQSLHASEKDVALPLRSNMSIIRGMALLSFSFLSFTELSQNPHGENKTMWGTGCFETNPQFTHQEKKFNREIQQPPK